MRRIQPIVRLLLFLPILAVAQNVEKEELPYDPRLLPEDYRSPGAPPPDGQPIRKYAEDEPGPTATNFGVQPVHDNMRFSTVSADRIELRRHEDSDVGLWDLQAWTGRDYTQLVVESEGEWSFEEDRAESADVELLVSRVVDRYWDVRAGVRYDFEPLERGYFAVGIQGLAPQWFETEFTAYLSEEGDLSAKVEVEYDMLFTQRLVLQPRLETELQAQDVPELGAYAGFTGWEAGLRLRYEFSRKFAPYVGASWEQALGETADQVEESGGDTGRLFLVAGVRLWL